MQQNPVEIIDTLRQTIHAMSSPSFPPEVDPDIWLEQRFNEARTLLSIVVASTPPAYSVAAFRELRELQLLQASTRTPSFVADLIGMALRNIDTRNAILCCQN